MKLHRLFLLICIALSQLHCKNGQKWSLQCTNPDPDLNRSDNPSKHTVHDKILDKVIEMGKRLKIKAKELKQNAVKRFTSKYLQNLTQGVCSLLCCV